MRLQFGCYLESLVRTDLRPYDSLSLRIKKFKRSTLDPECTCIVLRTHKKWLQYINDPGYDRFTLHCGINVFASLTKFGPKELESENAELVSMAMQVIATRDYSLIGVMLDRMIELDAIPAHPYWYTQWVELVAKCCTEPTRYEERLYIGTNVHKLPDTTVTRSTDVFDNVWNLLEKDGLVDDFEGPEYLSIRDKWLASKEPRNIQAFIFANYP